MKADGHTVPDIAKFLDVSKATCYRYLAEAGEDPMGPRGRIGTKEPRRRMRGSPSFAPVRGPTKGAKYEAHPSRTA